MPRLRATGRLVFGALLLAAAACATSSTRETSSASTTVIAAPAPAAAGPAPLVVYLVRHAEKADTTADPALSAGGAARAAALREALRDAGIGAVVVSDRKRTRETAQPLADLLGITPTAVPVSGGLPAHVAGVARAVRSARGAVLVVGHSNTVPAIIRALGGPAMSDICDPQYANLYILVLAPGEPAHLARAHYGAADPPDAACAAMQMRE